MMLLASCSRSSICPSGYIYRLVINQTQEIPALLTSRRKVRSSVGMPCRSPPGPFGGIALALVRTKAGEDAVPAKPEMQPSLSHLPPPSNQPILSRTEPYVNRVNGKAALWQCNGWLGLEAWRSWLEQPCPAIFATALSAPRSALATRQSMPQRESFATRRTPRSPANSEPTARRCFGRQGSRTHRTVEWLRARRVKVPSGALGDSSSLHITMDCASKRVRHQDFLSSIRRTRLPYRNRCTFRRLGCRSRISA